MYFIGCVLFTFAMLKQFPAHDYYFIDTYFLPVILLLIISISLIPSPKTIKLKIIFSLAILVVGLILIIQPINSQKQRRKTGYWDKTSTTIDNFENSSSFLDSLSIPKNSKMLVIDAVAPNIPFILMQRKGYAVMTTSRENIIESLKWDYDYIVFQNEYFITDIYNPYPGIIKKLNKIADNGKISVSTYATNNQQTLFEFIGLNNKIPLIEKMASFDSIPDSLWQNINTTDDFSFTGALSGHLTSDITYGLTYKSKKLPALKTSARNLYFSSYFMTDSIANCQIAVSIDTNGQNIYFKSFNLKNLIKPEENWKKVSQIFQLPKVENDNYEFSIFLWNTGKTELYYDNFKFSIY